MSEVNSIPPAMPRRATTKLPAGSCDCHNHIFGPFDRYPLDFPPDYAIPLAPAQTYMQMLDSVGIDRGVLVQPTQQDCSMDIMLGALRSSSGRLRGVASARENVSDDLLEEMALGGIVGLRFVEARTPDGKPRPGSIGFDEISGLAARMRSLDWSINVWAQLTVLMQSLDKLLEPQLPLVFEHMGMLDVASGIEDQNFKTMRELVKEGRLWVKLSACRVSAKAPDYTDLRPFVEALVETNPNQLLWGSDWPFIRMQGKEPDVTSLIELAIEWINDSSLVHKILVRNPQQLYKFEENLF